MVLSIIILGVKMGDDFGGTPNPLNPMTPAKPEPTGKTQDTIETVTEEQQPEPSVQPAVQPGPTMGSGIAPTPNMVYGNPGTSMDFKNPHKVQVTETVQTPEATTGSTQTPDFHNTLETATMGIVTNVDGTVGGDSLDPMNRPMVKAPTVVEQKPKKMRKGYLIAMLVSVLIAVGCGVTAILLTINKGDPVAKAVERLVNGETSNNVVIDGTINVAPYDLSEEEGSLQVKVKSTLILDSMANSTEITLSGVQGDENVEVSVSEIYSASGDLYLKFDGLTNILSVFMTANEPAYGLECNDGYDNCYEYDEAEEEEYVFNPMAMFASALSELENVWVRVPDGLIEDIAELGSSSVLTCATNLANDLENEQDGFKNLYNQNPFITSSTKDLTVKSKQNPIYLLGVDDQKFLSFANGVKQLTPINNFIDCMGADITGSVFDADEFLAELKKGPDVFVEIDNNYDFTRLYTELDLDEGATDGAKAIMDLNFSYPISVRIEEPEEYIDLVDLINGTMQEEVEIDYDDIEDITGSEI